MKAGRAAGMAGVVAQNGGTLVASPLLETSDRPVGGVSCVAHAKIAIHEMLPEDDRLK